MTMTSGPKRAALHKRLYFALLLFVAALGASACDKETASGRGSDVASLTEVVEGAIIVRSKQMDASGYVESEIVDEKRSVQLAMAWADPKRGVYEYSARLDETGTGRIRSIPLPQAKGLAEYNAMLVARYREHLSKPAEPYADAFAHARGCGPTNYDSCVQGHCNTECCSRREMCRFENRCGRVDAHVNMCVGCEQETASCYAACAAQSALEPNDSECGEFRECTAAEEEALKAFPFMVDATVAFFKKRLAAVSAAAFGMDPASSRNMMSLLQCGSDPEHRYCSRHKCFDAQCAERLLGAGISRKEAIEDATWCASDCQIEAPPSGHACACPSGQEWCHDGDAEKCRDENGNNARCVPTGTCGPNLLAACDCEKTGRILCVQTQGCASGTPTTCVGDQNKDGKVNSKDCDTWRLSQCACGAKGQPCCTEKNVCNDGLSCGADGKCTDACGGQGQACCALSEKKCGGSNLDCVNGKCELCGFWSRRCCDAKRRSPCDSGFECKANDGQMECLPNPCGEQDGQWCCIGEEHQCRPGFLSCGNNTCETCGGRGQQCCWEDGGPKCRQGEGVCSDNDICVQPKMCNSKVRAGGNEGDGQLIELGKTSGYMRFEYNTYKVADRMQVIYDGKIIIDTGCQSTENNALCPVDPEGGRICPIVVQYSGSSSQATVVVIPNCSGTPDTAWEYNLVCP